MYYHVNAEITKRLINLPESGVGYQIIEARPEGQSTCSIYWVFNAQLVLPLDQLFNSLKHENFYYLLSIASPIQFSSLRVLKSKEIVDLFDTVQELRNQEEKKELDSKEVVRVVPYRDDSRLVQGQLTRGSLCIQEELVSDCIRKGIDVIDHFGIPDFDNKKEVYHYQCYKKDVVCKHFPAPLYPKHSENEVVLVQTNRKSSTVLSNVQVFHQLKIA